MTAVPREVAVKQPAKALTGDDGRTIDGECQPIVPATSVWLWLAFLACLAIGLAAAVAVQQYT